MKIFKENKVYVQNKDLILLSKIDPELPESISSKILSSNQKPKKFIKFENPIIMNYFSKEKNIKNYEVFNIDTPEEIMKNIVTANTQLANLIIILNQTPFKDREKLETLRNEILILKNLIDDMIQVNNIKEGVITNSILDDLKEQKILVF